MSVLCACPPLSAHFQLVLRLCSGLQCSWAPLTSSYCLCSVCPRSLTHRLWCDHLEMTVRAWATNQVGQDGSESLHVHRSCTGDSPTSLRHAGRAYELCIEMGWTWNITELVAVCVRFHWLWHLGPASPHANRQFLPAEWQYLAAYQNMTCLYRALLTLFPVYIYLFKWFVYIMSDTWQLGRMSCYHINLSST